jgi:hypothetical protein
MALGTFRAHRQLILTRVNDGAARKDVPAVRAKRSMWKRWPPTMRLFL